MPLACPKCSRPNPDNAVKCLYCASSLDGAKIIEADDKLKKMAERFLADRDTKTDAPPTDTPPKPQAKKPPTAKWPEPVRKQQKEPFKVIKGGKKAPAEAPTFWVVLTPPAEVSDDVVKKAAEAVNLDTYIVRIKLTAGIPWVVKRLTKPDEAKKLAADLLAIGLDAHSITAQQISEIPPRLIAGKVSLIRGGLRFDSEDGKLYMDLMWSEIFLVVNGRIRRKPVQEGWKKKKEGDSSSPRDTKLKDYEVVDIFAKDGTGVRIAEGVADFSGLGKYMRHSSLLNMRWIQEGIEAASSPISDDGYRHLNKDYKPPGQNIASVIRSIKGTSGEPLYMDNSSHYDEYCSIAYLHYKKIGGQM